MILLASGYQEYDWMFLGFMFKVSMRLLIWDSVGFINFINSDFGVQSAIMLIALKAKTKFWHKS